MYILPQLKTKALGETKRKLLLYNPCPNKVYILAKVEVKTLWNECCQMLIWEIKPRQVFGERTDWLNVSPNNVLFPTNFEDR